MSTGPQQARALGALSTVTTRRWKLGPARNKVVVERGVPAPMRDGTVLLADHYAPVTSAPCPTVLLRGPYGRGVLHAMMALPYAERGYHVLLQSTRGTFGSGGTFRPYADEAADGQDTVGWLRQQDWFDGRLATIGSSYLAYTQWALALDPPPELRAMVVQLSPHDLGAACFGQGLFELYSRLKWSDLVAHQDDGDGALQRIWRTVSSDRRLAPALSRLPLQATADGIGGNGAPWYAEWLRHPDLSDPYWDSRRASAALDRVAVPTLLVSGYQDLFLEQTLRQYHALRRRGVPAALTIGPWTHLTMDTGLAARETLAWLDAFAAGNGPTPRAQPVRAWTGGTGHWHDLPDWPPAGAVAQSWYLRGDGALTDSPPDTGRSMSTFRYDPLDPTPSVGGRITSYRGGSRDNTELEARSDVLTFSTAALGAPVHVAGAPAVQLYVSCESGRADIFARLCDVDERGRSLNLTDQITRLGPADLAAGQPCCIELELPDASHVFRPGHRIRLQISGGAFPRYERNLGTGGDPATNTQAAVVVCNIAHDHLHPSAVTMPVLAAGPAGPAAGPAAGPPAPAG
jgi:uncharacterized protein